MSNSRSLDPRELPSKAQLKDALAKLKDKEYRKLYKEVSKEIQKILMEAVEDAWK